MDELDATFAEAYLSKSMAKQRLAEQMMLEIERILSEQSGGQEN